MHKRQRYLDNLVERIPHCNGIFYDVDGRISGSHLQRICQAFGAPETLEAVPVITAGFPMMSWFFGYIDEGPLFVRPALFERGYSEEEVTHCLVEHEGRHLMQFAQGLPGIDTQQFRSDWMQQRMSPLMIVTLLELDANLHAGKRHERYMLGSTYLQAVHQRARDQVQKLFSFRGAHEQQYWHQYHSAIF
ncbi:MAG: hypothetical protein ACOCWQ_00695 [Nanoarchaeota archaeon]